MMVWQGIHIQPSILFEILFDFFNVILNEAQALPEHFLFPWNYNII